jgi:hypothetical protein
MFEKGGFGFRLRLHVQRKGGHHAQQARAEPADEDGGANTREREGWGVVHDFRIPAPRGKTAGCNSNFSSLAHSRCLASREANCLQPDSSAAATCCRTAVGIAFISLWQFQKIGQLFPQAD